MGAQQSVSPRKVTLTLDMGPGEADEPLEPAGSSELAHAAGTSSSATRDGSQAPFRHGEMTPAEGAHAKELDEPDPERAGWMPARPGAGALPRPRRGARSTQLAHAVALYRESYRGLSVSAFRRALKESHEIHVSHDALCDALRAEGVVAVRVPAAWVQGAAPARGPRMRPSTRLEESPQREEAAPPPPQVVGEPRVAHELQTCSDRVERLNATLRDRIVEWRRGQRPLDGAVAAFAALKDFVRKLPE
jgi:hypothetical protein